MLHCYINDNFNPFLFHLLLFRQSSCVFMAKLCWSSQYLHLSKICTFKIKPFRCWTLIKEIIIVVTLCSFQMTSFPVGSHTIYILRASYTHVTRHTFQSNRIISSNRPPNYFHSKYPFLYMWHLEGRWKVHDNRVPGYCWHIIMDWFFTCTHLTGCDSKLLSTLFGF